MVPPYSSTFGRWCARTASSTASSCNPNSVATALTSSSLGSPPPSQTNSPSLPAASLARSIGSSPCRRCPPSYAAQSTIIDSGYGLHLRQVEIERRKRPGLVGQAPHCAVYIPERAELHC